MHWDWASFGIGIVVDLVSGAIGAFAYVVANTVGAMRG